MHFSLLLKREAHLNTKFECVCVTMCSVISPFSCYFVKVQIDRLID